MRSIIDKGNVVSMRGVPCLVCNIGSARGPYGMMSYATLTEAIYEAHARAPPSPQVMSTSAIGLVGCVILNPRTPTDALRWLKECHHSFHSGSRTNILEVLEDIGRIEASWAVFRQANGITSRACGRGENSYERQYFNYIQAKFLGRFKTWQLFCPWQGVCQGNGSLGHLLSVEEYDGATHQLLGHCWRPRCSSRC